MPLEATAEAPPTQWTSTGATKEVLPPYRLLPLTVWELPNDLTSKKGSGKCYHRWLRRGERWRLLLYQMGFTLLEVMMASSTSLQLKSKPPQIPHVWFIGSTWPNNSGFKWKAWTKADAPSAESLLLTVSTSTRLGASTETASTWWNATT